MNNQQDWQEKLQKLCKKYNLNIKYLADIINDPKVIPMIRGKSFEMTARDVIQEILSSKYEVKNPRINAQAGLHDMDISIVNKSNQKQYSVECKLAAKGSFRLEKGEPKLRVKCMRSRTLGQKAAQQRAKILNVPETLLQIHNDQYVDSDFDIVVTSIANAFYETDTEKLFYWSPSEEALPLLEKMGIQNQENAFYKMYAAKSKDLIANAENRENRIICTRKTCSDELKKLNREYCNFIPNYPCIYLDKKTGLPFQPWVSIENIETLLH
ncbi:hypothetical protein [Spirulina sp. 06S082]|uniref:hypothetical protein n=1 Tax=Spirulina sp. 06S082 TaxID=3110248 RepID=UPI002B21037C|nr:hypothetical protein [Spirulina sp. 06S082]MEA5467444.1 hypothetical protein [Spirulina sp. 06S082]